MEFINVLENRWPLYELCKKNGWTDCEYEDFDELGFFEGDPDMIKVNGDLGYFCECQGKVYYYFDDWNNEVEPFLKKFFETFKTGITLGGESWVSGVNPEGVEDVTDNHWETWENMETGIAYRGGAGYVYWISDWSEWQRKNLHTERVAS